MNIPIFSEPLAFQVPKAHLCIGRPMKSINLGRRLKPVLLYVASFVAKDVFKSTLPSFFTFLFVHVENPSPKARYTCFTHTTSGASKKAAINHGSCDR